MTNKNKPSKGFTLIEIVIAIAIIAILSTFVIATVSDYQRKTRNAKRTTDVQNYITALDMVFTNNGSYPRATPSIFCCLGRGYPGEICFNNNHECTDANDAIKPFLNLPIDDHPIKGNNGKDYRGYLYVRTGSSFSISWILESVKQPCGQGTIFKEEYYGNTYCRFIKIN